MFDLHPSSAYVSNPNTILLQPKGSRHHCCGLHQRYDTDMPARLNGIISAQDYEQSIERFNAALTPGKERWFEPAVILVALVALGILIAVISVREMSGTTRGGWIGGGAAGLVLVMAVAIGYGMHVRRKCFEGFKATVAAENARYQSHPGLRESGSTLSWGTEDRTVDNGMSGQYHKVYRVTQLLLSIGGAGAMQVFVPQSHQQTYDQQLQQSQRLQQYPPFGQAHAAAQPIDATGFKSPWAASASEGRANAAPSVSCSKCGRHAALASDPFCAACGAKNQARA